MNVEEQWDLKKNTYGKIFVMDSAFFCCRHQATEVNSNLKNKVKNAASILQQRKLLQRNLRNLQQHTLSREILTSKYF